MKAVTNYFRNAVACSVQSSIDYKNRDFYTISPGELEAGKLNSEVTEAIFRNQKRDSINMIIALKTIATEFTDTSVDEEDLDELTSVFFLPVRVNSAGLISMAEEGKLPWIPRDMLEPMIERTLSIGTMAAYDEFLEITTDVRNQIDSWKKYLDYAKKFFNHVNATDFENEFIYCNGKKIKTDGKFYIFEDETVNAVAHILELYNHILRDDREPLLYEKITNGQIEQSKELIPNNSLEKMKFHAGQMNGEFPLSYSQREAINHYGEIAHGEVLAVNGPPGTGKTTLLQAIVADAYVKSAMYGDEAPIIVATSTNNQAVTNIIDSFGKITPIGIGNLEQRWIKGVSSFATYFPSGSKEREASEKGYQHTNVRGQYFAESVESEKNREASKKLFIEEMSCFFDVNIKAGSFDRCKQYLKNILKETDGKRVECLSLAESVKQVLGDLSFSEYEAQIADEIERLEEDVRLLEETMESLRKANQQYLNRCDEWRISYRSLPWYARAFQFIPAFKKEVTLWSYKFMQENETDFLNRGMTISEVEAAYMRKVDENDLEIRSLENKKREIPKKIEAKQSVLGELSVMIQSLQKCVEWFGLFQGIGFNSDEWEAYSMYKINELLDRIRYVEFWLAVHYYECRWLEEENPITEKQKGKTFENVLNILYHRLAMLSPCFVMTCFMLPKQFKAYTGEKSHQYMYDYIDLLIVDEAGQISPEIGAAVFALAKKAVVVGDEKQIPPVWNITRQIDMAMAMDKKVISEISEFALLERNGLNCSDSSIMRIASLSCSYEKYGEKGLFLSEHRRCYNEIIEYCNALVYRGKLQPLRGNAADDGTCALHGILPPMGHYHVGAQFSQRIGTSRQNEKEANEIIAWLRTNYLFLKQRYLETNGAENFKTEGMLGIITPFKSQKKLIEKKLKTVLPEYRHEISVGTVHTFQGAERKIIIFSSVYGSGEGCFFINNNESLMNVAVSRAKDSFLVFGDRGCLTGGAKSAAALLKEFTGEEVRGILAEKCRNFDELTAK